MGTVAAKTKPQIGIVDPDDREAEKRLMKRVIKGAHQRVLRDRARLRKAGIIDEQGTLIKKPESSGSKSGGFGGWG